MLFRSLLFASGVSALTLTAGCSNSNNQLNSGTYNIIDQGINRTYRVYLPASYSATQPSPLLLTFHGLGLNPDIHFLATQWNNSALNPNYVVVAPQGTGTPPSWEGYYNKQPGTDDIGFTLKLLSRLSNRLCLDSDRFFANGYSNGGGFTNSLACTPETSSLFAGGAFWHGTEAIGTMNTTSANKEVTGCIVNRANTPIFEIHGGSDMTIMYGGDENSTTGPDTGVEEGDVYPAVLAEWIPRWARRNSCATPDSPRSGTYRGAPWYHYGQDCNVRHYNLTTLGHGAWNHNGSGGVTQTKNGFNLDVTMEFVAFNNQFTL